MSQNLLGVLILYGIGVVALLVAELKEDRRAQSFFKPFCALGFCLIAVASGGLNTPYGMAILWGLTTCAIGDICLLSRDSKRMFTLGMAAFGIGHIAYILSATHLSGPNAEVYLFGGLPLILLIISLIVTTASGLIWQALENHMPIEMKIPVLIYTMIITVMLISCLYRASTTVWMLPLAALMFAVSDFFVAKDRFVKPNPKNALGITPLYFGAQALLALSV